MADKPVDGSSEVFDTLFGKLEPPRYGSFADKTVLITGAGGSIGSRMAELVARTYPAKLILVDHTEWALYEVQKRLSRYDVEVVPLLVNIREKDDMIAVFKEHKPDLFLHAAALKHVPMLEARHNALEAIRTNTLGTGAVFRAAVETDPAIKGILVSTDKAVNPSSHMGLTKRCAELNVMNMARRFPEASFGIVRFGNVYGSSGSAAPLFEEQIKRGGPVTITDYQMTRYMMTIKDAVSLVLAATEFLNPGQPDLFVLDMPLIRIVDMAKMLIRMSGENIELKQIGIRPGEKLHEELFTAAERFRAQKLHGMFRVPPIEDVPDQTQIFRAMHKHVMERDLEKAYDLMRFLVPEYGGKVGV